MPTNPIKTAVTDAVVDAVKATADNPNNALQPQDVGKVARQIQIEIASDPAVQHATNTEPWYQSRVTLGALATIFAGIGTEITLIQTGNYDVQAHVAGITAICGAFVTLWGRWVSTRPIGS